MHGARIDLAPVVRVEMPPQSAGVCDMMKLGFSLEHLAEEA